MPRTGQIIPAYLVPHVQTYINDNTAITETTETLTENGTRLLCVFTSARGEDGVIKTLTNVADYIDEYGTPDFAKYGQPCYMPYSALSSGYARCHCLRVMPNDATYANVVICAYAKTVTDPDTSEQTFTVKFGKKTLNSITNKDNMSAQLDALAILPPEVDDDGYNCYPLFAINARGRGEYGNTFRVRVVGDSILNSENDYQNYILEVLDMNSGSLVLKEQHRGSFDNRAVINNETLLFDDIMGDPEFGSKYVNVHSSYENFVRLYNAYKASVNGTDVTVPEFGECNLLNGLLKDDSSIPNYAIAEDSVITLDTTIGIELASGSDGSIGMDDEDRLANIDALYMKAFNKEITTFIGSKRAVPCDLILDANYSEEVKLKMAELALKRYDARCILDFGILTTTNQIKTWLNKDSIKALDDFIISKECNHKQIRDPFTNRLITVTYTYDLANQLPTHYQTVGNQVPFVGEAYSTVTNAVKNSVKPEIDADDMDLKEYLYTHGCNFVECIAENTYVRATQVTSQSAMTDLSEENNVAVLLEMKRMLEEFVSKRIYNFAEAEDRQKFTEAAERMFMDFQQTKVRSSEVYFDMNAFEEERSILHCYLSVVFRTMAKRGIIEIDINKRV